MDEAAITDDVVADDVLEELTNVIERLRALSAEHALPVDAAIDALSELLPASAFTESSKRRQEAAYRKALRRSLALQIIRELVFLAVLVPAITWSLAWGLGEIIRQAESWQRARSGMNYALAVIIGMAQPIGQAANLNPETTVGRVWSGICGIWALAMIGVIADYSGSLRIAQGQVRLLGRLFRADPQTRPWRQLGMLAFVALVLAPLYASLILIVFGLILAHLEGWAGANGVWYLLATFAGLPNPLVNNNPVRFLFVFVPYF